MIDYRDSFIWTLPHAISATIIWSVTVDRNTALNDRGVVWGKMAAAVADGKIAVESGFIDSIAT